MATDTAHSELLRSFGRVVRDRREELDLTQEEVAHRSGLHRTYVGDIERGARNVALANIWRLSSALDLTAAEVMQRIAARLEDS